MLPIPTKYVQNIFNNDDIFVKRWIRNLSQVYVRFDNYSRRNSDRAVEYWIQNISSSYINDLGIIKAAEILGDLGDKRALKSLVAHLVNDNVDVTDEIRNAIWKIGLDESMVEPLIKQLDNWGLSDPIKLLGEIGDDRALKPLVDSLGKGTTAIRDTDIRYKIEDAIMKIGLDESIVEPLIKLLMRPGYQIAAKMLGEIGDERALKPLMDQLKRRDKEYFQIGHAILDINPEADIFEIIVGKKNEPIKEDGEYYDSNDSIAKLLTRIGDKRSLMHILWFLRRLEQYTTDEAYYERNYFKELIMKFELNEEKISEAVSMLRQMRSTQAAELLIWIDRIKSEDQGDQAMITKSFKSKGRSLLFATSLIAAVGSGMMSEPVMAEMVLSFDSMSPTCVIHRHPFTTMGCYGQRNTAAFTLG